MQSLFATVRKLSTSRTDATDGAATPAAGESPVETGRTEGPQVLGAHELLLVSGGDGDPHDLPVTKW